MNIFHDKNNPNVTTSPLIPTTSTAGELLRKILSYTQLVKYKYIIIVVDHRSSTRLCLFRIYTTSFTYCWTTQPYSTTSSVRSVTIIPRRSVSSYGSLSFVLNIPSLFL